MQEEIPPIEKKWPESEEENHDRMVTLKTMREFLKK